MRITRDQVIEAIRTEPLHSGLGRWVEVKNNKCTVCAVGAVLRSTCNIPDKHIGEYAEKLCDIEVSVAVHESEVEALIAENLEYKRYLSALSVKFEAMREARYGETNSRRVIGKQFREELVKWVVTNLPHEFEVALNKNLAKQKTDTVPQKPKTFAEIMTEAGLVSAPPVNVTDSVRREIDEKVNAALAAEKEEVPA